MYRLDIHTPAEIGHAIAQNAKALNATTDPARKQILGDEIEMLFRRMAVTPCTTAADVLAALVVTKLLLARVVQDFPEPDTVDSIQLIHVADVLVGQMVGTFENASGLSHESFTANTFTVN